MNCTELFLRHARSSPDRLALQILSKHGLASSERASFGDLLAMAERAQALAKANGVQPGDSVLMLDGLGLRLYSSIIGLLAMGVGVILVEPWMPVSRIERVIRLVKPKLFLSTWFGYAWGARVSAIREIPKWVRTSQIDSHRRDALEVVKVASGTRGIVTFTSGTTGEPKGVVRNQDYLVKQHEVLSRNLDQEQFQGPDLCIFANFALMNLASGRGSIIVPPSWDPRAIASIDDLPKKSQPESMTSGPAFLAELMRHARVTSMKSIHVGGAQTDCALFEEGFAKWPAAHFSHIYGGSEVEPVALSDAKKAVEESRARGLFQSLLLGNPVSDIQSRVESSGLWVAGPHVCPEYLGNEEENRANKKKDASGVLWHFMGDRVVADAAGWWYQGRAGQAASDFALEQRIYSHLCSSRSFIQVRKSDSSKWLVGEGVAARESELKSHFKELAGVAEAKIIRDHRHRARIDRAKTLKKGAKWLAS